MQTEPTLILLFLIASIVAIGARRLHLPYTVSLVLVGLGLGALQFIHPPVLTKDILFMVFLPGLIFEAAFNMRFANLWRDRIAVLGLAIPGVAVSIALTATLLVLSTDAFHHLLGPNMQPIGWGLALVFGAAVAATDPIAVVALFRRLGVPPRLTLLLEGESLLNDGTAIVFFGLVLSFIAHQTSSPAGLLLEFGRVVGGGLLVGGVVGLVAAFALQRIDDAMIEITITMLTAYGSFLVADQLGFSGVISTVTAGLACGNYVSRPSASPGSLLAMRSFWEYLGFALNSLVFLLMGFEIRLDSLLSAWPLILLSWLAVTLARGLLVAGVQSSLRFTTARIPRTWGVILTWGGLRGALSMVLALSLPADLPARESIINLVFGFVLLSIMLQGLSMTTLARRLGLVADQRMQAYEAADARRRIAAAALREIGRLRDNNLFAPRALDALESLHRQQLDQATTALDAIGIDPQLHWREDWARLGRHMLAFQQNRLADAHREGSLSDSAYERLRTELDARTLRIETGDGIPPAPANDRTDA